MPDEDIFYVFEGEEGDVLGWDKVLVISFYDDAEGEGASGVDGGAPFEGEDIDGVSCFLGGGRPDGVDFYVLPLGSEGDVFQGFPGGVCDGDVILGVAVPCPSFVKGDGVTVGRDGGCGVGCSLAGVGGVLCMDFYTGKDGMKKQDACQQHGNPAVPGVSDGFVVCLCLLHENPSYKVCACGDIHFPVVCIGFRYRQSVDITTARQCLAVRCIFNFFTHPAYIIDDNMAGNF